MKGKNERVARIDEKPDKIRLVRPSPPNFEHLLPARVPGRSGRVPLANIPRRAIGRGYALEMVRRFPGDCFLTVDWEYRTLAEFGFEPFEAENGFRPISRTPAVRYPRLKVRLAIRGEEMVEVANIVADPVGIEVFSALVQGHPGEDFYTNDFGCFPLAAVDLATIRRLNGLPK